MKKFILELNKIFDEAVREAIYKIPALSIGFKEQGLLKEHVDNEKDFYLGAIIAAILEKYKCEALKKGYTIEQVTSTDELVVISILTKIPKIKEEINSKIGL